MTVIKKAAAAVSALALVALPVAASAAPAASVAKLSVAKGARTGAASGKSSKAIGTPLFLLFAAIGIGATAAIASGNGSSSN